MDYQLAGKEIISEALDNQARLIERLGPDNIAWTTVNGSSHLYEFAARRIGNEPLSQRFIDPAPDIRGIVERGTETDAPLTAVLTALETREKQYAQEIESMHRDIFYVDGLGYLCPHVFGKEGYIHSFKPEERTPAARARIKGEIIEQARSKDSLVHNQLFSAQETLNGLYMNLALGNVDHARVLVGGLFDKYFDDGVFHVEDSCTYVHNWARGLNIVRAMDILEHPRTEEIYKEMKQAAMENFRGNPLDLPDSLKELYLHWSLCSLAFTLDYFREDADEVKSAIISRIPAIRADRDERLRSSSEQAPFNMGLGVLSSNRDLVKFGLAVLGVKEGSEFYFA